jgi:hypothetical protein
LLILKRLQRWAFILLVAASVLLAGFILWVMLHLPLM